MISVELDSQASLTETLRASLRHNPGIALGVWWNVALLLCSVAAVPFDHRLILGINPWIKPIKFDISVIIFLVTVGFMLQGISSLGRWRRSIVWMGWGFGVVMIVENSIIALQSARGVRSHMNFATVHDAILFSIMGLAIALNSALASWLLVLWCVTRSDLPRVVVWGVRLGLVMLLVASAEGVRIIAHGAHTVGAPDGLSGLPFVNWSRAHGDLRVAHFFALHCLQIFPLAGLLLARTRYVQSTQLAILFIFAGAYAAAVWWLFALAMRGMPFL